MATPSEKAFGDLLRRHRKAAGLTQAELAERAWLTRESAMTHTDTVRAFIQVLEGQQW